MNSLTIVDLDESRELDAAAAQAIFGGSSANQGIGNGATMAGMNTNIGPGLLFASPITNVQIVAPVTTNIQIATVMDMINDIRTTNILGSIIQS